MRLRIAGVGHHWDRVLSMLDDMAAAGVEWDAFTLSALLSACQAGGKWEQALEWFERAQRTPGEAWGGWLLRAVPAVGWAGCCVLYRVSCLGWMQCGATAWPVVHYPRGLNLALVCNTC